LDAGFPVDLRWEEPQLAGFLERLGGFCRVMSGDARGQGSSDPFTLEGVSLLDAWMDDATALMDAADSERAAIVGAGAAGAASILYTATHPERVSALVLINTFARFVSGPDYPCGLPPEMIEQYIAAVQTGYATMDHIRIVAPSMVRDDRWCRWFMRSCRVGGSPSAQTRIFGAVMETNVHHVLPSIQVPTLVLHRRGDRQARVEHGRYLADHIPGAVYRELDGDDDVFCVGDTDTLADEIEEFLTGVRPRHPIDRVLTTVLFTDIVDSSKRAADMGDRAWRKLLDAHDAVVRTQLERFRGREIKTTGDGFLATFDGPGRGIRCASELVSGLRALGLDIRAGLHTGEVEIRGDDIGGIAVHVGSRVAALATAGQVLVSSTVKDLVAGSGIEFDDRGEYELKGLTGSWRLFAVTS
jgi:class 3 adenylate cyclase